MQMEELIIKTVVGFQPTVIVKLNSCVQTFFLEFDQVFLKQFYKTFLNDNF